MYIISNSSIASAIQEEIVVSSNYTKMNETWAQI